MIAHLWRLLAALALSGGLNTPAHAQISTSGTAIPPAASAQPNPATPPAPAATATSTASLPPTATPTPPLADPAVTELLRQINLARLSNGRPPLAEATELDSAAQAHSEDMVANAYLDHVGSDGSDPQERAARAGYRVPPHSGWIVVEVISAISADPSGPVNWWINGDPAVHGRVVLNPRWHEFGGGYAQGGPYGNYWTALFGCRPGTLPLVTFESATYQHVETCDG